MNLTNQNKKTNPTFLFKSCLSFSRIKTISWFVYLIFLQIFYIQELDEFNRPFHKISLLCGAPGLGKTTLAHIIARHAGYHVVEMNAR